MTVLTRLGTIRKLLTNDQHACANPLRSNRLGVHIRWSRHPEESPQPNPNSPATAIRSKPEFTHADAFFVIHSQIVHEILKQVPVKATAVYFSGQIGERLA